MQLDDLMDQLESALAEAPYIPLTTKAIVDQNLCLDLLDKIREILPSELANAKEVLAAKELLLARAEADAEEMRERGRAQLEQAAMESEAVALANLQAREIVAEGERQAREMAAAAAEYSDTIYRRLEDDLTGLLETVRYQMPESTPVQ